MEKLGIAVKGFIVDRGKILIIKRSNKDVQKPGAWEIPGGRIDLGINPKLELIREIKEETNLDVEVLNPLNIQHFTRDDGQVIMMLIFLCKKAGKNEKIVLSNEHIEYEWIDVTDAKKKLVDFFHGEVDIYLRYFK